MYLNISLCIYIYIYIFTYDYVPPVWVCLGAYGAHPAALQDVVQEFISDQFINYLQFISFTVYHTFYMICLMISTIVF